MQHERDAEPLCPPAPCPPPCLWARRFFDTSHVRRPAGHVEAPPADGAAPSRATALMSRACGCCWLVLPCRRCRLHLCLPALCPVACAVRSACSRRANSASCLPPGLPAVEGRTHSVQVHYLEHPTDNYLQASAAPGTRTRPSPLIRSVLAGSAQANGTAGQSSAWQGCAGKQAVLKSCVATCARLPAGGGRGDGGDSPGGPTGRHSHLLDWPRRVRSRCVLRCAVRAKPWGRARQPQQRAGACGGSRRRPVTPPCRLPFSPRSRQAADGRGAAPAAQPPQVAPAAGGALCGAARGTPAGRL